MAQTLFCKKINSLVLEELYKSGFSDGDILCVGVSGGADSICLLTALVNAFCQKYEDTEFVQKIFVVSINHKIRSEAESGGDCDFVKKYCNSFALKNVCVECDVVQLKKGQVLDFAQKRKRGIEEAARFLRYECFTKFSIEKLKIENKNKVFFALAHNQNDQLETLLMRFLSGSANDSRCGILETREVYVDEFTIKYVRPLLQIERCDIEKYLNENSILWRTDSTNSENSYFRNKIRNIIIPVLDQNIFGWKKSVLQGRKKAIFENEFINKSVNDFCWQKNCDGLFFDLKTFESLDVVLRQKLIYKAFNMLGQDDRIPFVFVNDIVFGNYFCSGYGVEVSVKNELLYVKKVQNKATICGFFAIIENECELEFDFGKLFVRVTKKDSGKQFANLLFVTNDGAEHYLNKICMPFIFRSRQSDDAVFTKEKKLKSVSDVFSNFKVALEHKDLIPVIQNASDDNSIMVLWSSLFGYSDWIV